MLDLREIEQEIAVIEHAKNHSPKDCMYLAALYSIRDHQKGDVQHYATAAYSQAAAPITSAPIVSAKLEVSGNSDFMRLVSEKDGAAVWRVLDQHMDNLKMANPNVYDGVMRQMTAL